MYYKLNILDKLLIPLLLLLPFFLFSQDMRDDSTGLYLTPEQVITNEDWSKFSELHQSNSTDPQTKIQEIEKLLEKYYSQFVGEKRILEEKINGETFSPGISQNTLRLLVRDMKSQKSQTYLIRDSDMLFEIYETLGDLYKSVQNNPKSVWSYAAALRYRDFTNSEAKLISEFQDKKSGSDALQKHIAIKENYEKAKLELKEAKDSYYLERSKDIRTPNIKFLQQAPNFGAMENKVEKAEKDYQNSLKVNIQPLIDRKGEKDSNVIYKLAEVVKIAEDENQERLKVLDKSNTFWGEPFILFDTKKNTNLFAYEQLLEFAYKLYPKNPKVMRELAETFRNSGKNRNSLDFYLKYLDISLASPPTDKEEKLKLTESYLKIGMLYSTLKRYVQAVDYYEKYVQEKEQSEEKTKLYFHLGDFYSKQLGNYPKSAEYFRKWLEATAQISAEDSVQKAKKKAMEFRANYGISLYYKFLRLPQKETQSLESCYATYNEIKNILKEEDQKYQDSLKQIHEIKKELLNSTNDESLARLEEAKKSANEYKANLKSVQTQYNSISKNLVLFKLAEFAEENRDFQKAKEFYHEIVQIGNEIDINRALKDLSRVDKTIEDGIIRDRF